MERKINLENIKIIRKYLDYLKEAAGLAEATVDDRASILAHYEEFIEWRSFKVYNEKIATEYKQSLLDYKDINGRTYSKKTIQNKLKAIRDFNLWLVQQPGYRSHIYPLHINYLRLDRKTLNAISTSSKFKKTPTYEEALTIIGSIPSNTEVDRRDRALISSALLTGIRASSLKSIKIDDIDLKNLIVTLDPLDGIDTKFGKYNEVCILPFDNKLLEYLAGWIDELLNLKNFKLSDPLFPMTDVKNISGTHCLSASVVKPKFWKKTSAINKIFTERSQKAELPTYTPHSYRRLHYQHARRYATNTEQQSALSQNISHSSIEVSETYYGNIDPMKRKEILSKMRFDKTPEDRNNEDSKKLAKIYEKIVKE